jgi:hypothetical protein
MFLLSNFILKNIGIVKSSSAVASYSIAIGMVIYAAIYLYILYNHQEKLAFFNNILIYVVSIDLLLSSALYNKQMLDSKNEEEANENNVNEIITETLMDDLNSDTLSEDNELVASDESTFGGSEQDELEDDEVNFEDDEVNFEDEKTEDEKIKDDVLITNVNNTILMVESEHSEKENNFTIPSITITEM